MANFDEARWCNKIEVEDSHENDRSDIEKSSNLDVLVVALDFDSDTILLGYPRQAEHTEVLHQHH